MKRALILIMILAGIIIFPLASSPDNYLFYRPAKKQFSNDTNHEDIDKWEYLKPRLFPIGGGVVPKFKGPVLISLEEATKEQKELVQESIDSINSFFPNKDLYLYEDYTGYPHQYIIDSASNTTSNNKLFYLYTNSISISFGEKPSHNTDYIVPQTPTYPKLSTSILSDSTVIKRNNSYYQPMEEIKGAYLSFNFSERTNAERKKKYITYELLRSLCYLPKDGAYIVNAQNPITRLNRFQYRFNRHNGVFSNSDYSPEDYQITHNDIFLIKKLYSDDFLSQFKNYLENYYPPLYVYNFYHGGQMRLFAEILIILLGAVIFMISLSLLHKKRFRFSLFNYFIPILLINIALLGLFNLKDYLQLNVFSFVSIRTFTYSFLIMIVLTSIIQSLSIWVIEYFLMRKLKGFILNLSLKFSLTLILFIIPYFVLNPRIMGYSQNIFLISLVIAISRGLYIYLNHYSASITRKKDLEISQLKELQLATELNSLHAQINPHFLYNALNSIASLAKFDGVKTEQMALSLSDLFRYSVNRKGQKMTTIKEEVEMVQNYLQIEKIRFEDRLEYTIDVESSIESIQIPRFILQPLVENAIKHGISKIEEKGTILLEIIQQNNHLLIAVSDNGPDFPDGLVSGHGLQSVFDLLHLSYGKNASLNWENLPKKKITITIDV